MSLASLRLNEARLRNLLKLTNTRDFLQLIWAVNVLQSDHPEFARPYIRYPKEAETNNITDKFAVYKWELETLVNLYFKLDNGTRGRKSHRSLNTGNFDSVPHLINALRAIENSQAGRSLPRMRILNEMHRIGQRQFDWQWGFDRLDHLFRFAYIYIQGDCQNYLEEYFSNYLSATLRPFDRAAPAV